jgi:parvulin-like peptidyl-prolyl isomerase
MRVAFKALAISLSAAIALTGCSKREDLKVAEFKDHVITVGEFETAYSKVDEKFLPKATGLDGKKEFLNTMLNKEVMAYKADELGYDKNPTVVQGMEAFSRAALQVAFLKKAVADKITVSDDEVKNYFDNEGVILTVKQILCDIEPEAEEAFASLKKGVDFETVCKTYSKTDDAADGGMIVTVTFGKLMPELQDPLFALPVGGFTDPIFTPHGWIIIKVLKRSDAVHKASFDEEKDKIRTEVHRLKEAVAVNAFTEKLRNDYGVQWNYDNIGIAFNALPPDRSYDDAPRRSDEIYPLLYFDPKDLEKPLVTYQGKSITIKDFSDLYDQASFFNRPRRIYRYGGIRSFLTERIMSEISADAVSKSHIEDDPEVKQALKSKKEEIMVNLLYEDMVNKQTVVTAQQIQNYYKDNQVNFFSPEKRKFGVVLTGDVKTAKAAYHDLKSGAKLETVVLAYSVDEETKETMGETKLLTKGEQPEIDAVGFSLAHVGDVSEPFETSRGWTVLKLLERDDATTYSLEDARSRIEAALRDEANDKRLKELLAKWKDEVGVTIYEKNLEKAQLVDRSAAAPTPPPAKKASAKG